MNFKSKQQFDPHGFDLRHQDTHPHYLSNPSHTGDFYSIKVFKSGDITQSLLVNVSVIYQTGRIFILFLPSIKLICQDRDKFWIGGGLACNVYINDQVCVCLQLASAELLLACLH